MFLTEIDTAEEQLKENRINKLRDIRDLVGDEFEKYYRPSDVALNYVDSLLEADETNSINKRSELNSKLKSNILLLAVWKFLLEEDIL